MRLLSILSLALLSLSTASVRAAGPTVTIVTGKALHPLEQMAADEVAHQLRELFDATIVTSSTVPERGNVIVVGSWPSTVGQEHFLKSVKTANLSVLMIGGGEPQSTYWAAIEFGRHFGVRRLLHADFQPLKKPKFSLDDIDVHLKPVFSTRAWLAMDDAPAGLASWSLADHRLRLQQLAKLKFNRIILPLKTSQPFLMENKNGKLWSHQELRVDGETAGRAAFGRERVFRNPDVNTGSTSKDGVRLIRGIIAEANRLGMKVSIVDAANRAEVAAYSKTYPKADSVSESGRLTTIQIGNLEGNILPLFDLERAHAAISDLRQVKKKGFAVACQLPDDLNTSAFYLSRAGFDADMTPARAVDELVSPICGDVSKRIAIGFDNLAKATVLINRHDPTIATPRQDVIMRHYAVNKPAPEWWAEAKTGFIMAMNEMYRANTRARGGARAYSLYLAKKFEFGLHYFTCLESIRAAGIAKAAKDKDAQLKNLDKAVEAMHNAMSAIADVDRNNGDRGIIALFNEYGFRPLVRELEKADQ
jgi:hypothetical protein